LQDNFFLLALADLEICADGRKPFARCHESVGSRSHIIENEIGLSIACRFTAGASWCGGKLEVRTG
jgi:hypothetical protein